MSSNLENKLESLNVFVSEDYPTHLSEIDTPGINQLVARGLYQTISAKNSNPFVYNPESQKWYIPKYEQIDGSNLPHNLADELLANYVFIYLLDMDIANKSIMGNNSIIGDADGKIQIVDFSTAFQGFKPKYGVLARLWEDYAAEFVFREYSRQVMKLYDANINTIKHMKEAISSDELAKKYFAKFENTTMNLWHFVEETTRRNQAMDS